MRGSIASRLDALEKAKPGTIILEVVDSDGQTRRLTARQYAENGFTWPDGKIVAGNSLDDLDLLLSTVTSCIS